MRLAIVLVVACAASPPPPPVVAPAKPGLVARDAFSEASLIADITWLTAPERRGRGSKTADAIATATWIEEQLRDAGYAPTEQLLPLAGQHNVIASHGSGSPVVIVSAHYDHLGVIDGQIYPGADDNASGVAVALAVARDLAAKRDVTRRVIFLFTAAEEVDLDGAKAFVAAPTVPLDQIRVVYNLDMVGRHLLANVIDEDAALASVGVNGDIDIGDAVRAAAERAKLHLVEATPGMLGIVGEDHRTDDWIFRDHGVNAVHFSTGLNGEYHTPRDTLDRLSRPQLVRIARFLRDVVATTPR